MSLSKSESPIRKVIFLQKIFRFAGRTVKDLVIINFVCKDFEETMQAHHTFNLVLYDNIIKKQQENQKEYYLERLIDFLAIEPAWIVYQSTVVNDHDETQRELLKELLHHEIQNEVKFMVRDSWKIKNEDPATTLQLLRHHLDSCIKLGIAKDVFMYSSSDRSLIHLAICYKLHLDSFKILLDFASQHHDDLKELIERRDGDGCNFICRAAASKLSVESFELLLDFASKYADLAKMLQQCDCNGWNCIALAAGFGLPIESFALLLSSCLKYSDFKKILVQRDVGGWGCITHAAANQLPPGSFKLLLDHCVQHADIKTILEQQDKDGRSSIMHFLLFQNYSDVRRDGGRTFPAELFRLLLAYALRHADLRTIFDQQDCYRYNVVMYAAANRIPIDSFKLLIAHFPSNDLFQSVLKRKNDHNSKAAIELAKTDEAKTLLRDPECWKKCRTWLAQNIRRLEALDD